MFFILFWIIVVQLATLDGWITASLDRIDDSTGDSWQLKQYWNDVEQFLTGVKLQSVW